MIVFGLILVLLALAAGVALFLATQSLTTPVDLELAGYSWGMTPLALLVAGAAVMLLLWLGLGMIRGSAKRRRRPAREAKEAERQAKMEESIRADERARAEETHQSTLAERDRVRDEEFQTRLADRDRERDDELQTRLTERDRELESKHSASQQETERRALENEERVRADERSRVEQEFAARSAGSGPGTAGAAGAGAAASGAVDSTAGADTNNGRHSADVATDGVSAERQADTDAPGYGRDDTTSSGGYAGGHSDTGESDTAESSGTRDSTGSERSGYDDGLGDDQQTSTFEEGGTTGSATTDSATTDGGTVTDREAEVDSSRPGFRTVADKIMGRDPADHG